MMWEDLTVEERLVAAKEFQSTPKEIQREIIDPTAYLKLRDNSEFVAGVVDGRGKVFRVQRHGERANRIDPRIMIGSRNKQLLDTLRVYYGGRVYERVTGREGKEGTTIDWVVTHKKAEALYSFIKPHLLLRAEEAARVFGEASI